MPTPDHAHPGPGAPRTLRLVQSRPDPAPWLPLLRRGVQAEALLNTRLLDLLVQGLDLSRDLVDSTLRTIFLDGRPVDDPARVLVRPGSVVALAGPMPGAAGICLRRDSPIAAYRSGITHAQDADLPPAPEPGRFTLKLFNAAAAAAPAVLARGVLAPARSVAEVLAGMQAGAPEGPDRPGAELDGAALPLARVRELLAQAPEDLVRLRLFAGP